MPRDARRRIKAIYSKGKSKKKVGNIQKNGDRKFQHHKAVGSVWTTRAQAQQIGVWRTGDECMSPVGFVLYRTIMHRSMETQIAL
jgi:hypothetical protein